jgi:hypothetical protein
VDYAAFNERALVRAIVEADLGFLTGGARSEVLGRKLYGVEMYAKVADACIGLSPQRRHELADLKWDYLAEILLLPAANPVGSGRHSILRRAGHAEADALLLVQRFGCKSPVVQRIVAEVGS